MDREDVMAYMKIIVDSWEHDEISAARAIIEIRGVLNELAPAEEER